METEEIRFIKIYSIEYLGEEDVYNLEVDHHKNFLVNGGFVVHNCMDAWRYSLEEIQRNMKKKIRATSRIY